MLVPMMISAVFVLALVAVCLAKPNAGRIVLGLFFLAMAIGVNGSFTLSNPQAYSEYAQGALIPLYRDLALSVITLLSPTLFGLLLMAFEITMGVLLLHKRTSVKMGLVGTMFFLVGIAPLSIIQLPWLGLMIGQGYLLTQEFDCTLLDSLRSKLWPQRKQNEESSPCVSS